MSTVREFGQVAQRLARNPLGIIALFIVLVYGIAALLLGSSGDKLGADQRWLVVWFLVLFPVVVLLVFYRLVTLHHAKLYAPTDYRDETLFFRTLPPERQKARIEFEVHEAEATRLEALSPVSSVPTESQAEARRTSIEGSANYLLVEELALRQLELEVGRPISRQVEITGLPDFAFDGALLTDRGLAVIEIKYTRQPLFSPRILSRVLDQFVRARAALAQKGQTLARLYFVVVADMKQQNQLALEQNLRAYIQEHVPGVELRVFDLAKLKEQFGASVSS